MYPISSPARSCANGSTWACRQGSERGPGSGIRGGSMNMLRKVVSLLVVLAMLAVGVLFALQNPQPVGLDLLLYEFAPRSLALWLLAALAVGGVLGMLVSSVIILRLRTSLAVTQ